jgi:hypothetical protein
LKGVCIEPASKPSEVTKTSFFIRDLLCGIDFNALLKISPRPKRHRKPPCLTGMSIIGLSVKSAAAYLHVSKDTVSELIAFGFLKTNSSTQNHRVTINSIEAFEQKFIKISALAKEHGVYASLIAKRLKTIGIEAASKSFDKTIKTSFYVREELLDINFETLLRKLRHRKCSHIPPIPLAI